MSSLSGSGGIVQVGSRQTTVNQLGNTNFAGSISGTVTSSLVKQGAGTLTLSGNNGHGINRLQGGTLAVSQDANLGISTGVLDFAGGTLRATASFSTSRSMEFTTSGTIEVDIGVTLTHTFNTGGLGPMIKAGGGTLKLNGTYNHIADTIVSAGTLVLNGAVNGDVMVQPAGTLAGNGQIFGNAAIDGILSPGENSTDLLEFLSSLALGTGSTTVMELASASVFDRVTTAVGEQFTFGGTLALQLVGGFQPFLGQTFDLFDSTAEFGNFNGGITFDQLGYAATIDYDSGVVTIVAVPEPTSAGLLGASVLVLGVRRRKAPTDRCLRFT